MTTERKPRRAPAPDGRPPLTPLEWRLGLTAVLGIVYLAAWSGISSLAPVSDASEVAAEPEAAHTRPSAAARTVWFDRMPATERPVLDLPPGYRLASSEARVAEANLVARNDRIPRRRAIRIRTRSS